MSQLQMIWPKEKLNEPPDFVLPAGYSLRTYRNGDKNAYVKLMRNAGFDSWGVENFNETLKSALPNGLFFVVCDETGDLVATTVAQHAPSELHPFGGSLGWVAGSKDHSGKGLGYVVCAAVTKRLVDAGYEDIYLLTDDFRLPAVKTYLKLGWTPLFHEDDMKERWKIVLKNLKWPDTTQS